MSVLDYARGGVHPRRRRLLALALIAVVAGASLLIWRSIPQRPTTTRMAVYGYEEMRRTAGAARAFRDANGRLPTSLAELRASPFGGGLVPGRWERKLKITWLGERGRELDILACCFPGEDGHGGVVLLRPNLEVEHESWIPFVRDTWRKVDALTGVR
jgi:hypothetical protein